MIINLKDVTAIRYSCNHCQANNEIPVCESEKIEPCCSACSADVPFNFSHCLKALYSPLIYIATMAKNGESVLEIEFVTVGAVSDCPPSESGAIPVPTKTNRRKKDEK